MGKVWKSETAILNIQKFPLFKSLRFATMAYGFPEIVDSIGFTEYFSMKFACLLIKKEKTKTHWMIKMRFKSQNNCKWPSGA